MAQERPEERWAAAVISAALGGVSVQLHDDGSAPGRHDLNIVHPAGEVGAVEVTTATDAESTALWRLVNPVGARWCEPRLIGGWNVSVVPTARATRLRHELPDLLFELEASGIGSLGSDDGWPGVVNQTATDLGIVHAHQGGTDYAGSIYITIDLPHEQTGGVVADNGDALPTWLGPWVRQVSRSDNLSKLARSGASERHLFVIVRGFSSAPFGVVDMLLRDQAPLPIKQPDLPIEITHAWAMSTWSTGDGFRWSRRSGWQRFSKLAIRADRDK